MLWVDLMTKRQSWVNTCLSSHVSRHVDSGFLNLKFETNNDKWWKNIPSVNNESMLI